MSRVSTMLQMSAETRRELKRRLRASGYGDYEGHTAWLLEQGVDTSKSAVHRFGRALKEDDQHRGIDIEALVEGGTDLADLWDRLAELRDEESRLLQQIRGMMRPPVSGMTAEE